MFAKVNSLGLFGLNAFPVEVETEVSRGTPCLKPAKKAPAGNPA